MSGIMPTRYKYAKPPNRHPTFEERRPVATHEVGKESEWGLLCVCVTTTELRGDAMAGEGLLFNAQSSRRVV